MTPQQISDYKRRWMPGTEVTVHSDLQSQAKEWCKQLEKHRYHFKKWTNVYEHTFCFENEITASRFAEIYELDNDPRVELLDGSPIIRLSPNFKEGDRCIVQKK